MSILIILAKRVDESDLPEADQNINKNLRVRSTGQAKAK